MADSDPFDVTQIQEGDTSPKANGASTDLPGKIGRYRIERILGNGGFGVVYLAFDEQLVRSVAVKVPHANLIANPEKAEAYLAEARTVANLDHPSIVPVYDIGKTDEYPCFIVSKFIDGTDLSAKLKLHRFRYREAAEVISTVANALHYAHTQKLVHRDIKPGNILIDMTGEPYVVDFGLALREGDVGTGPNYAGTPAYMSPEQARGEGHRVDGRSDIFSLGVVFYEVLAGRRPFSGETLTDLLEQVARFEPRPLVQYHEKLPKELQRICLKAMSKRASERYTTAQEMADDLKHFLTDQATTSVALAPANAVDSVEGSLQFKSTGSISSTTRSTTGSMGLSTSDGRSVKIVPKGLRSFDAHDADFFLELLPGPRDREGLPDSLRFWKTRIEEADPDNTFSVGLIYGPSGCGKSSLVKAGLLPRLSEDVTVVYIEATPQETETRLLRGLRKQCPALDDNLSLKKTLALLRRGKGGSLGKKVVIIIDQFEQWLHAKKDDLDGELVQALRQCDGGRVQCIVMVRDDFWMAVTRFLGELEVLLVPGQNSAAVDLFDLKHATTVLRAFGRAFGTLPEHGHEQSSAQKVFVEQAVSGLAEDGKVICVRLALFAEMMKGKSWTPATLKEMGGTEGVGVTFLEETFSSQAANPTHRYHQQAARAVLNSLLPDGGTDIKGHMRSYDELLEISGYAYRPKEFQELIRILDGEVRLITPTTPEGKERVDQTASLNFVPGVKFYQLAHDYLVHSLRAWLTRKQKETRRGRAELLLEDRAGVWNARQEIQQLPSLWQWLQMVLLTSNKHWTLPQRKFMKKAGNYHAARAAILTLLLVVTTITGLMIQNRMDEREKERYAADLVRRALEANVSQVLPIIGEMREYRKWVNPLLQQEKISSTIDARQQLHTSLSLLSVDPREKEYLYELLLTAEPQEFMVIRQALSENNANLEQRLWTLLENPKSDQDQRFRSACALSEFAPNDPRWKQIDREVAGMLAMQKPFLIALWADALKGVRLLLIPPLAEFLVDENRSVSERGFIAGIFEKYAADTPAEYALLERMLNEPAEADASLEQQIVLAKKRANIGSALMVMGRSEKVWPLLKGSSDPTLRSYLIEWFEPFGVDAKRLLARLEIEPDDSVKRSLLLSLGEYGVDRLPISQRMNLLPLIRHLYRDDPDSGIHGAAGWLLKNWQMTDQIETIDKELATGKIEAKRQWYLTRQEQTMVVIREPGDVSMGQGKERHQARIDRDFAISSFEISVEQLLRFQQEHSYHSPNSPTNDCPINGTTWFDAIAYCNWLSDQEGLPKDQWCYEPNAEGRYDDGVKMMPQFLKRSGYRLPTEAEWEYACRAGTNSGYYFGESIELLGKYAWFVGNSLSKSHPVGTLRCNDLGLFDMHGNIWEWCQDAFGVFDDKSARIDQEENLLVNFDAGRIQRGGSFNDQIIPVRSAGRYNALPMYGDNYLGFRIARTLPLAQPTDLNKESVSQSSFRHP